MGKKVVLILAVMLILPVAAMADSDVSFATSGGLLLGTSAGMNLTGAQLVSITSPGETFTGTNLGTLSFSTNIFAPGSNSVITNAHYRTGGVVTILGNGSNGAPLGTLFSGSFTTNPSWTLNSDTGQNIYTFSGVATGTFADGGTRDMLIEFTLNKGAGIFPGSSSMSGVTATIVSVPEPGSLAFMGSGFAGLVGVIWRKRKQLQGN